MTPKFQGVAVTDFFMGMKERNVAGTTEPLKDARVTIAGAGGLGSNIAIALARSGVGHLTLIDFDVIEMSNLNRQQYKVSQVGMPKVVALKQNLIHLSILRFIRSKLHLIILKHYLRTVISSVRLLITQWPKQCYWMV